MGETLDALHRLQVVELQLAGLRREREAKSRRVEVQARQVKVIDEKIQRCQQELREQQMRIDSLSLDVATREESVARHREGLNRAKTNKEYSAILAAMNTEKADNSKIESKILEIMDEQQKTRERIAQYQAERDGVVALLETVQKTLANYDADCAPKRAALMAQREECAQAIAPTTLASFSRVAEHNDGEAMAAVAKAHPKRQEFLCSGCNMKLTLEVVNSLQTRDDLQLCPCCGRILYLEPSLVRS